MKILVLSGPNLQKLGKREPHIYGSRTLDDIHRELGSAASSEGAVVEGRQSNHEGVLLDWIGAADAEGFDGIVLNPGAFTHTSYAIYDAIRAADVPVVEVHLSNPEAREEFRHRSVVAAACVGKVAGFGPDSYFLGLLALIRVLRARAEKPPH